MTMKGGYFKKYLHVDLTEGKAERPELSDDFVEKYIGGRGFGAKFVWDNLKKHNFKIIKTLSGYYRDGEDAYMMALRI